MIQVVQLKFYEIKDLIFLKIHQSQVVSGIQFKIALFKDMCNQGSKRKDVCKDKRSLNAKKRTSKYNVDLCHSGGISWRAAYKKLPECESS